MLRQLSETNTESFGTGACIGMIKGTMNTLKMMQILFKSSCTLPEIEVIQGVRIILKYLSDNPQKLHEDDTLLIGLALTEAFPC